MTFNDWWAKKGVSLKDDFENGGNYSRADTRRIAEFAFYDGWHDGYWNCYNSHKESILETDSTEHRALAGKEGNDDKR